jgi:hypothetical protein
MIRMPRGTSSFAGAVLGPDLVLPLPDQATLATLEGQRLLLHFFPAPCLGFVDEASPCRGRHIEEDMELGAAPPLAADLSGAPVENLELGSPATTGSVPRSSPRPASSGFRGYWSR